MNKACLRCGRIYEREEGFFTGPMFLDCVFLPVSAIPTMIIFAYNGAILMGGVIAVLQMALISPFVFRYSRIFWIRLDYILNPEK